MPILNVNKRVLGALLTFASLSMTGVSHAETLHFGEVLTHQPPLAVSALLASPEAYLHKTEMYKIAFFNTVSRPV